MNLNYCSKLRMCQSPRTVRLKVRVKPDARRYLKVMAGTWDMEHHRQKMKDAGISYEQAVVIVDAINSGIEFVLQEVKSRYTPVFGQVLKKQEKLSGEVDAVGKEVQAAKHSQAQAVQDVGSRFTPDFEQAFKNQVKLYDNVGELMYEVQAIKKSLEHFQNSSGDLTANWEVSAIKRQVEATHTRIHEFRMDMMSQGSEQTREMGQKFHSLDMVVTRIAADVRFFGILILFFSLLHCILVNAHLSSV